MEALLMSAAQELITATVAARRAQREMRIPALGAELLTTGHNHNKIGQ
jgi:hypothetical protein